MISYRLSINDKKTEYLIIASYQQRFHWLNCWRYLCVRNLGVHGLKIMSMNTHVVKICSKAFRGLHTITYTRKFLAEESTKSLVHAFVTSHLDYCNLLLYGIPKYQCDRLQRILNAAARVICVIPKFNHVTTLIIKLVTCLLLNSVQDSITRFEGARRQGPCVH